MICPIFYVMQYFSCLMGDNFVTWIFMKTYIISYGINSILNDSITFQLNTTCSGKKAARQSDTAELRTMTSPVMALQHLKFK